MEALIPISNRSCYSLKPLSSPNPNPNFRCFGVAGFHFRRDPLILRSIPSLKIRSAATKQAKSPAEEDWKIKRELLLKKRVRSVDVKEALRLQKENNFVILDVRPEAEFKEGHPPGAINVQIYRLIKEWTAWDIARRAAFAFFGIFSGTEENPEFLQSILCTLLICLCIVVKIILELVSNNC
eukprot:TRINITY_DN7093_c0_g1_i3.p1 TRINITY_DN7093_c0_g1~~TRINITY_DN7093_c0_g1_i3.p1  ORF type:complete len:206 (-),score=26.44 TRINITY_DN7093_c0_g1_i3:1024-1569(-)